MFAAMTTSPTTPQAVSPHGAQGVSDTRQHKRSLAKEMKSKFSSFFSSGLASISVSATSAIDEILSAKPKESKPGDLLSFPPIGEDFNDLKTHIAKLSKPLPASLQSQELTDGYSIEFDSLVKYDHQIRRTSGMFLSASKPCNSNRNRFRNVLPNETTRVKISPKIVMGEEGEELSDYINANFISGKEFGLNNLMYIATQAPMPSTANDFYQMCWEQNVGSIVVLANEIYSDGDESPQGMMEMTPTKKAFYNDSNSKYDDMLNMNKVQKYWPSLKQSHTFGSIQVTNIEEGPIIDDICVRKLEVKIADQPTRIITMYQYAGWPDMGVPKSPKPFLKLIDQLNSEQVEVEAPKPIVVHCIAGIGRTGTFCAVHITFLQMKEYLAKKQLQQQQPPFKFNIYNLAKSLKNMRQGMIQKQEQYVFCYNTILIEAMELGIIGKDDPPSMASHL